MKLKSNIFKISMSNSFKAQHHWIKMYLFMKKVIQSLGFKGADNLYTYTVWAIKNMGKVRAAASAENDNRSYAPKTKFDNFEPRQYDYDDLEKKLLGWI